MSIKNDKQQGTPFVDFTATKAEIEALPNMRLGAHAVATNNPSAPFGVYVSGGWVWYSTGSVGGGSGGAYQRNLTANMSLADGESLVVSGYINQNGYDIILAGDAIVHLIG